MPAQPPHHPLEPEPLRLERWLPWLLAAAVLLAFSPVIPSEFVRWDDPHNTFANDHIKSPSVRNTLSFWSHPYKDLYIPFTYTLWSAISSVAQTQTPDALGATLNPYLFHAANLLLHVISALLTYRILRLLTKSPLPSALGAALFALHPVQVESVAWISGLKDVLAGCLALSALYLYLLHATTPDQPGKWRLYTLATLSFLLAMLSKPSAVTLPLLAATLDYFLLRRPLKPILLAACPWLLLALPIILIARLAQPATQLDFIPPLHARPLIALDALAFYVCKLLFPLHLALDYGRSPRWLWSSPHLYWTWAIPLALAATLFLLRRRFPTAIIAAALFPLALLPTLGLLPFDFQAYSTTADHYLYLPMLAPALLLAALFGRARLPPSHEVESRPGSPNVSPSPVRHALPTIAALVILSALSLRTFTQSLHWRDSESLFSHTLSVNPSSLAGNVQLAILYLDRAEAAPAQSPEAHTLRSTAAFLLRRALLTHPHDFHAHRRLGDIYVHYNQLPEAATHFRAALRADPSSPDTHTALGAVLARAGDLDSAITHFEQALRLDPNTPGARQNLERARALQQRRPNP